MIGEYIKKFKNKNYEYMLITRFCKGYSRIADEDISEIEKNCWEIIYFHVDKFDYTLQLKRKINDKQ
jgi:hypothetical protein